MHRIGSAVIRGTPYLQMREPAAVHMASGRYLACGFYALAHGA
jgi:hypothetical protein